MYQQIWGSEEDYANSFAPSQPASKHIPAILNSEYPDAEKGEYIILFSAKTYVDNEFASDIEVNNMNIDYDYYFKI